AAVTSKSFGQIFDTKVNGQVYAPTLSVGNSVLVATEDDYVYSINRNTGAVNWSTQLGTPYAASTEDCGQTPVVEPYVGVTSAPVYDPSTGTLYVSGMLSGPVGDDSDLSTATPTYDLFAINEAKGTVEWHKVIAGSPTNSSKVTFNAALEMQRPGLLLLNGSVYMGFGALCADGQGAHQNYVGYVAGVNTKTQAETLWTDETTGAASAYGGVWQGGGGLLTDGKSIYVATANGTPPPPSTKGSAASAQASLGQSVVKLNVESNGSLVPADYFSPSDAARMTQYDHDFGSSGPIVLPFGTKDYPHLIATADKEADVFLLNEASLGGRGKNSTTTAATGSTAVFTGSPSLVGNPITNDYSSDADVEHGLWGHMAAFAGIGANKQPADYLYYQGAGWGSSGPMYALKFDGTNPAAPKLEDAGHTALQFGFSSGSPVVTSSGTSASSALVWEIYSGGEPGQYGSLNAYSAQPTSAGVLQKIWSAPIGNAAQFSVPTTSDGRIYVGARNDATSAAEGASATTCPTNFESTTYTSYTGADSGCVGEVYGFGPRSAELAGSTVNLGHVALGQSVTKTVTLTNTGDTPAQLANITTPSVPFGTPVKPAFNQPIAPGASVSFPVTFTPQATGTITGKYVVTSTDGYATHTTTVAVGGVGAPAASGTAAVPSPGGGWTLNGSSTMTGTTLQLTPAKAGQVGSAVFYQPVVSNHLYARFTARLSGGNGGDGMTFSLLNPASATTARGAGAGELGYGGLSGVSVVLGTRKDAGDPSANFVGIATGTSHGHLVFAATSTKVPNLRSGTHVITVAVSGKKVTVEVNGRGYVSANVPVTPTVLPAFTAANGSGADIHAVSGAYITTPDTSTLPSPGGNWSYNGTAAMAAAATTLTTAAGANQAGAIVYPHAVSTSSFSATFNVALGGGTGGDGMTLALLNPGTAATAVGGHGTDLGFAGLNGLAVVLGTTPTTVGGATSSDFVGVETSTAGGDPTLVAGTDLTGSVNLRSGTHIVTVSLKAGTLTVTIDGTTVLTQPGVTVPSSAYVAFTGSTGSLTDRHLVQNAAIAAG
ncbi:MAG TPA: choice-of-anchor D domain-containing protein, partial [Trebonia sp.]